LLVSCCLNAVVVYQSIEHIASVYFSFDEQQYSRLLKLSHDIAECLALEISRSHADFVLVALTCCAVLRISNGGVERDGSSIF